MIYSLEGQLVPLLQECALSKLFHSVSEISNVVQSFQLPTFNVCFIGGVGKWIADDTTKPLSIQAPRFAPINTSSRKEKIHYKLCHLYGVPVLCPAALGQFADQSIACSVSVLNHNRITQRRIPAWAEPKYTCISHTLDTAAQITSALRLEREARVGACRAH